MQKNHLINKESFIVSGPNGAGKTLFLEEQVTYLIDEGHKFSYFPQSRTNTHTFKDEVALLNILNEDLVMKDRMNRLVKMFDAKKLVKRKPKKLSDGQQALLHLIICCSMNVNYYILDEFTNGLDKKNTKIAINVVKGLIEDGKKVVVCTHDESVIKFLNIRNVKIKGGNNG